MNLSHYTAEPFTLDPFERYEQSTREHKPVGLWVSVDGPDDWPSWCQGEEFGIPRLQHRTPITLAPEADVLVLASVQEVLAFNEKYGGEMTREFLWIDWPRVAQDHDGLIIAPYQWPLRLHRDVPWYYPWDCASGCIWNLEAVAL